MAPVDLLWGRLVMPIAYPVEIMKELGIRLPQQGMSGLDLSNRIQSGLPLTAANHFANRVQARGTERSMIISKAQYARLRLQPGAVLSATLSARLVRLASVWIFAIKSFGNEEIARNFLHGKHPLLNGKRPVEVAAWNSFGADAVIDILDRLRYGTFA